MAAEGLVLPGEEFRSRWPEGTDVSMEDANKDNGKNAAIFVWSDLNSDGQVQPDEAAFRKGACGGVTVMSDLSFCASRVNGSAMQFVPVGFTDKGIPRYEVAAGKVLAENVAPPASSGGDQALAGRADWNVVTLGIAPFPPQSVSGAKPGTAKWSYPSLWPGLHAGHESPKPDRLGELLGTTRLLGGLIEPKGSDAGQLWALNSNHGHIRQGRGCHRPDRVRGGGWKFRILHPARHARTEPATRPRSQRRHRHPSRQRCPDGRTRLPEQQGDRHHGRRAFRGDAHSIALGNAEVRSPVMRPQ
jgi:hypothetical protein